MKKQLCALLILATAGTTYSMEIETEKTTSQDLSGFSMRLLSDFICNKNEDGVRSVLAHAKDLDKDLVMEKLGYQIAYATHEIFYLFLQWGINVNKRLSGPSEKTVAMVIAENKIGEMDAPYKLRMLVENPKTDLNAKDLYGCTAIINAATQGHDECLELLLESRAKDSIDEKNIDGRTALMQAANFADLKCVKLLIHAGARVDLQDKYGNTALSDCVGYSRVKSGSIAKLLISHGADVNVKKEIFGRTPLMDAVRLRLLLDTSWIQNADLDIQDSHGETALMHALQAINCQDFNTPCKNAKLIIAGGADVTLKDREGKSALGIAQHMLYKIKEIPPQKEHVEKYTEIIDLLKQRENGASALEIAKQIRNEMSGKITLEDEKNRELQTYNELIEMLEQQ